MDEIVEILKNKGISPSFQRISIYGFLHGNRTHPKVNDVYNELKRKVPSLSKTTVYNTIKLFSDKGLIQEILIEGNEIRLDADITTHGHFKCTKCGKLYDIPVNKSDIEKGLKGFTVDRTHIYYTGICRNCAK